jgi:hypothetical protein
MLVPMSDLKEMARAMGENKLFGKTPQELLPLMLIAQAEGKHPAIAAQEYDIISGKPAINSKSALARFQTAGGKIQWITRSDTEASAEFSHPQGGKLVVTWTMERANKTGVTNKDVWKKYPTQMLSARVVGEGVRAVFPACLSGMYLAEEVEENTKDTTDSIQGEFEEIKTPPDLYKTLEAEVLNLMNTRVKPVNSPDADKYSDFERMIIDVKELYKNAMTYRDTEKLILLKKRIEFYEQYRGTDLQEQALNFIEKKGDDYQSLTFENFEND